MKTVVAIQPILQHSFKVAHTDDPFGQICFELLGLDVLLDSRLEPHLLEVNHAPSLACESAVDLKVKLTLVADLLRMLNVSQAERVRLAGIKSEQARQTCAKGKREYLARGAFLGKCL